jgi:hypothetical protein
LVSYRGEHDSRQDKKVRVMAKPRLPKTKLSRTLLAKTAALASASLLVLAGCTSAHEDTLDEIPFIGLGDKTSQADAQSPEPETTASAQPSEPSSSDSDGDSNSNPAASDQEYALDLQAEIDIEDQSGDGARIALDKIQVGRNNAFVVIYNSAGEVLATALVTPLSQPVNIALQTPITSSQELQAVLYLDDGDGKFELSEDLPLIGEENELVHEDFSYRVTG